MSRDHRQVQRLRFAVETTFGADATGDVANNFDDLRVKPTVIARTPEFAEDETSVQRFHQQRDDVKGPDRGSCAIESYWTSTNEAIDDSTTVTKNEQQKFLEVCLGGYNAPGQGSLSASGEATTGCVVTATEGDQFTENSHVGIILSGVFHPRLLATADPGSNDTLVWWPALPSAIVNATAVHNAENIYYNETTEKWIQILHETALDRGNLWLLSGGNADLSLNLARGGLTTWSSTVNGALFEHDDEIATPQGGSALAAAAFTDSAPIWGNEGGCHFAASSSSTLTLVNCVEINVDFGVNWQDVPDHNGVEGVGEWFRDRGRKTIELTIIPDSSGGTYEVWHDAMVAGTDYGLYFWLGATAGATRAIGARNCQIIFVEPVEVNGMEAQKLTLLVKENQNSTGAGTPTTAIAASPIVLGHL